MINTKRNNRLETYRGDTGILNVNVAGYEFVEGDLSNLEKNSKSYRIIS